MQERAAKGASPFKSSPGSSQYIYNADAKVIFAVNPKVMSTSSKLMVDAIKRGGVVPTKIPPREDLDYTINAWKNAYKPQFADYTRVMFIRNPYARLYSAWTNKFRDMPDTCRNVTSAKKPGVVEYKCNMFYSLWVSAARKILTHEHEPIPANDQDILRAITWEKFLRAVVDQVIQDKHWRNQVRGIKHSHIVSFSMIA